MLLVAEVKHFRRARIVEAVVIDKLGGRVLKPLYWGWPEWNMSYDNQ